MRADDCQLEAAAQAATPCQTESRQHQLTVFSATAGTASSGAVDRPVHDGSPAPEQRGDLPDAFPLLHVHPYSFGALTRAQSLAAAKHHAA